MRDLVIPAVSFGVVIGIFLGSMLCKALVFRLSKGSRAPRVVIAFAVAGALLALAPAGFLAFVVGANFGGAWADAIGNWLHMGSIGVPFGLAIGTATVLASVPALGALFGGLIGSAIARVAPKPTLS